MPCQTFRQDSQQLIDGIWQTITDTIANNRGLSAIPSLPLPIASISCCKTLSRGRRKGYSQQQSGGWLVTAEEFRQQIGAQVGWQGDMLNGIDFQSHLAINPSAMPVWSENAVGVITVQGAIMESGLPSSDVASAEELVEQIRIAKTDDRIKALVLRVDSPAAARLPRN